MQTNILRWIVKNDILNTFHWKYWYNFEEKCNNSRQDLEGPQQSLTVFWGHAAQLPIAPWHMAFFTQALQ